MCGTAVDTGAILLDNCLRQNLERHTVTCWGLCPENERQSKEVYVALVECDPQRSGGAPSSGSMRPEQAYRTGRLAYLKREAFAKVFNVPVSAVQPCVFVVLGVIDQL